MNTVVERNLAECNLESEIYKKLQLFKVSTQGDSDIFWQKLKEQTGWSQPFAESAFVEYKRFLFLAATGEERMVPSQVVDSVWHLHLAFSQSYWLEMCRGIFKRDIHHCPSPITKRAKKKDLADYQNTLESYLIVFGEEPSRQFWPRPKELSREKMSRARLPRVFSLLKSKAEYIGIGLGMLAVVSLASGDSGADSSSWETLGYYLKWALGLYIVYRILKWLSKGPGGKGGGGFGGCSASCSGGCGGGD